MMFHPSVRGLGKSYGIRQVNEDDKMSEEPLKIKVPTGVRVHDKITRVCKIPWLYAYDKSNGLYVEKWKISEVYMSTKFIEGFVSIRHEENGLMRRKNRYYIETWPEMSFKVTPEILEFVEKKKLSGDYDPLIYEYAPPPEVLAQTKRTAARLYRIKRKENLENIENFSDGFMTFEMADFQYEPASFSKFIDSDIWKTDLGAYASDFKLGNCVKVFEKQFFYYYISKYTPQPLTVSQMADPHWRFVNKLLGYKKVAVVSMIAEVDMEEFEKIENRDLQELFAMVDMDCAK